MAINFDPRNPSRDLETSSGVGKSYTFGHIRARTIIDTLHELYRCGGVDGELDLITEIWHKTNVPYFFSAQAGAMSGLCVRATDKKGQVLFRPAFNFDEAWEEFVADFGVRQLTFAEARAYLLDAGLATNTAAGAKISPMLDESHWARYIESGWFVFGDDAVVVFNIAAIGSAANLLPGLNDCDTSLGEACNDSIWKVRYIAAAPDFLWPAPSFPAQIQFEGFCTPPLTAKKLSFRDGQTMDYKLDALKDVAKTAHAQIRECLKTLDMVALHRAHPEFGTPEDAESAIRIRAADAALSKDTPLTISLSWIVALFGNFDAFTRALNDLCLLSATMNKPITLEDDQGVSGSGGEEWTNLMECLANAAAADLAFHRALARVADKEETTELTVHQNGEFRTVDYSPFDQILSAHSGTRIIETASRFINYAGPGSVAMKNGQSSVHFAHLDKCTGDAAILIKVARGLAEKESDKLMMGIEGGEFSFLFKGEYLATPIAYTHRVTGRSVLHLLIDTFSLSVEGKDEVIWCMIDVPQATKPRCIYLFNDDGKFLISCSLSSVWASKNPLLDLIRHSPVGSSVHTVVTHQEVLRRESAVQLITERYAGEFTATIY